MKTLILFFLLFTQLSYCQFKIGNIEVDKETFTDYIIDCYERPDTLKEKFRTDYIYPFISYSDLKIHLIDQKVLEYNDWLHKFNIGVIYDDYYKETKYAKYIMPRKPTETDFIEWFNERYNCVIEAIKWYSKDEYDKLKQDSWKQK